MFEKPDLLEYVQSTGVQLKRLTTGEYQGPCPVCGGKDRFHIFRDLSGWGCRKCRPDSGGVFDLIAAVQKRSIEDVMKDYRSGSPPVRRAAPKPQTAPKPADLNGEFLSDEWQSRARQIVIAGMEALKTSQDGQDYLHRRGISPASSIAFRLGYCPKRRAIIMPWAGRGGKIVAIKYRLLVPKIHNGREQKMEQETGGSQLVFGGHLAKNREQLILTEGEMNAVSLWQALGCEFDVLSFGGDANWQQSVPTLAPLWKRVLIWVDNPEKASAICENLRQVHVKYLVSPDNQDANDLLVRDGSEVLGELVKAVAGAA